MAYEIFLGTSSAVTTAVTSIGRAVIRALVGVGRCNRIPDAGSHLEGRALSPMRTFGYACVNPFAAMVAANVKQAAVSVPLNPATYRGAKQKHERERNDDG